MLKNKLIGSFLLTVSFFCISLSAYATSDPVGVLQHVANNMIAGLKANKATLKSKPQIVYNLAYKYVVPYADLTEMSKHVLSPSTWNSATPSQRKQFQHEFTRTLIRTYASALTSYQDQTIRFYPIRGGMTGASVEVNSEITGSGNSPIRVTYRMVRSGSSWRLYDMSVEGVSMLDSFRSQFADMLAQGSMDQLLSRMSGHNRGQRG